MQCDKARLYEVLHGFGYFVKFWKDYDDVELGVKIIHETEIEKSDRNRVEIGSKWSKWSKWSK